MLIYIGSMGNCYKKWKSKKLKKARQDIGILAFSYKYCTFCLLLHNRLCNLMYKRLHHFTRDMGPYFTSWRHPPGPFGALVVLPHPHFHLPTRQQFHPKPIRYSIGNPLDIANFLPSKARLPKRSIGLTSYKTTLFPNTYCAAFRSAKYLNFPWYYLLLPR